MAIPETQLETWSHQGSVKQSSDTYNGIRNVLLSPASNYATKQKEAFLQGSYCNDTNIWAESDVDIVMRLDSVFYHDLTRLDAKQRASFEQAFSDGGISFTEWKADVAAQLRKVYGAAVTSGSKAIKIAAGSGRRSADVVAAAQFRRYERFADFADQEYVEGICFFLDDNTRIVNFPKQHSANCTTKHQATDSMFKHMVRIWKNMRGRLEQDGTIPDGLAPSYFIEGLLYNVPNDQFVGSYGDVFVNCYNWIQQADSSQFVCANLQFWLLRCPATVTWAPANFTQFMKALGELWNEW